MGNSETKTQSTSLAPAQEVKSAMAGFLNDFNSFQAELKTRLKEQESRLTMLDRKQQSFDRPTLSHSADTDAPHKKAFAAYLRSGDDDALRHVDLDEKALNVAVSAEGGYLVDPQTADQIASVLHSSSSIRSIANVVQVEATAFDVLIDHSDIGFGWASETGNATETSTPQIDRVSIPLHELSALPKASQRLLDDSAFDVEGWLAGRIADRFARAEAAAYIAGDGSDKPTGFLNYTQVEDSTWTWGNLGYVATGSDGDFNSTDPADAIVDLVYALGARYRAVPLDRWHCCRRACAFDGLSGADCRRYARYCQ